MHDANGGIPVDALAAGARFASPLRVSDPDDARPASPTASPSASPTALSFRVGIQLGGVLLAESRSDASDTLQAALEALSQSLPQFTDLEASTSVSIIPQR